MKLTLGFSPCPNDTFIFDALVNHKIDTGGLEFDAVLEDVETLNEWALQGKLDVTKLSFPAFFRSSDKYILLQSGAALGKGVGPLLITKKREAMAFKDIKNHTIVLPGENTTANLLFSFAYPEANNKKFMRFDLIEDYILSNLGDLLGVIIHENRFTYQQKGLHKVADLGEVWEEKTKLPVPLGGIAANRKLERTVARKIDQLIRQSIGFAFNHYPLLPHYVKEHSQAMEESIMRQHIELYVNDFSLGLGPGGEAAISGLREVYYRLKNIHPAGQENIFLHA
jgi:1,4-dihydroxy-6-naphthoate synthase